MSVVSGILAADSQNNATDKSSQAQANATGEQQREFNITQQNFEPYKDIGAAAAPKFQDFISGKTDISNDPLYKNQMTAATREATQRAAGSGQSSAGGAFQTRLAQLGNQIYNNTYQTKYQEITDALKTGQGAAGSISNAGAMLGNQMQAGAQNLGNIYQNNANTMSSLYGGMSGQATSLVGRIGSQNGWWGGSGGNDWQGSAANQLSGSSSGGYTYNDPSAVGPFTE